jgi:hypothetical protein
VPLVYAKKLAANMSYSSGDTKPFVKSRTRSSNHEPASQIVERTNANDLYASNTAYTVDRACGVNGLNQYTSAGPATFSYDANGNLTTDGSTSFVYDGEDRLVSASGGRNAALAYDPLGGFSR